MCLAGKRKALVPQDPLVVQAKLEWLSIFLGVVVIQLSDHGKGLCEHQGKLEVEPE